MDSMTLPHLASLDKSTIGEKLTLAPDMLDSMLDISVISFIAFVFHEQPCAIGMGNAILYPLIISSINRRGIFNLLLDKGADVNYQSKMDGITALNVTTNAEIADIILKAKADPNMAANASCLSALQMAVINNNYDLAEVLLKYGADANHVDCKDYKPVIANAIDTGNPAIVRLLLNYNAGVNTEVGEDLSVKVIDYANQKGNKMIIDMINEKLQQSMPKKQEVIEKDNASSLIKNNVKQDNKSVNINIKDNISKDNKSDNVLIKENTETKVNKNDNNSSNEIDDIMNNIVNGL